MVLRFGLRAGLGCGGASLAIVVCGGCVQKPDRLPAECGEDRPKVRRKGLERLTGHASGAPQPWENEHPRRLRLPRQKS
jgi:hypothetical protein